MNSGQATVSPTKDPDIRRALDDLEHAVNLQIDRLSVLYDKQSFVMSCIKQPEAKDAEVKPIKGMTPMSQFIYSIVDKLNCNLLTINTIINQTEF